MNTWFKAQAETPATGVAIAVHQDSSVTSPVLLESSSGRVETKKTAAEILRFLARPFRRFMVLWCVLLLVTTHVEVVWLCLIVVLAQLARQIFVMLQIFLFSPWVGEALRRLGPALQTPINNALAALAAVTPDAAPTDELKKLWNQLLLWRQILNFFADPYLLSRWAWVLGFVFLVSIYTYIAVLFSFAYYGIARVSGVPYTWGEAVVTSVFIPFFFTDLPRTLAIKWLSGVHLLLVLGVGIGTVVNFLRRKLDAIRTAATDLSARFAEQSVREKYIILEEKFATEVAVPAEESR